MHSRVHHGIRFQLILGLFFTPMVWGQAPGGGGAWRPDVTLQTASRPRVGLDAGGDVGATQYGIQAGITYASGPLRSVGLGAGIGLQDYHFSGDGGFASLNAWDRIHSYSVNLTWRESRTNGWTTLIIPSLRSRGESGASTTDTLTGGAILLAAYRFSPRLTLGPGIGIFSDLEDDADPFPFLVIDWDITERLNFGTGRGTGASQGPGLGFSYTASDAWTFGFGGRYEKLRFRLDGEGPAPGGVGQDDYVALVALATRRLPPFASLTVYAGMSLDGELRLEDQDGDRVQSVDTGEALMVGLALSVRQPGGRR